ncbi:BTAD domain-containing putative transcriptional regulator [Nocardia takedensis]|uniref:AfsR/SARP family transcriptional regulator n=1 Tax=Nocardia takedensis TaxID=259390 RepID=UPI000307C95D|nr:BTAD domain-containing putative transcriptional regulator [Nocardia takedensis]
MYPEPGGRDRRSRVAATPAGASVVVALLGEVALRRDDTLSAVAGTRARVLVAALALRPGRSRSAQALIEDVWGDQPPRAPMNALHTQVSRLRSALPEGALEIGPAGYRLRLPADAVDLSLAGELTREAARAHEAGDAVAALVLVGAARSLWRGEPGADLPSGPVADELRGAARDRSTALDDLEIAARRAVGDQDGALAVARRRAAADPLDEQVELTLLRLLAAAGRATEALESFAAFRTRLADELGADPGRALVEANTAILRGEPLDFPVPARSAEARSRHTVAGAERSTAGTTASNSGDPHEPLWDRPATGSAERSASSGVAGPAVPPPRSEATRPDEWPTGSGTNPPNEWPARAESADEWAASSGSSGRVESTQQSGATAPAEWSAPAESTGFGERAEASVPPPIGLRAAPTELLGRQPDLDAIVSMSRRSRVTTVLGPGGTGKTRVANEVGARVARSTQVVLIELASVRAEGEQARTEVEAAIGAALGLTELAFDSTALRAGYTPDPRRRLRDAVAAREMLLILDNCEHLIDAVAVVVADLIGVADRLTVLTTSRAPLMITAESVYPLPPLTVDAAGSPATELFAARARAVRPSVRLDPEVVARLCRTLDGLPLAIELAAARVRTMSVEEINTRLADRFALLRHGDRSSPARHRTLHAVIDWSWALLDDAQRVTLRRLCRFPAGFGVEAAEIAAGGPEVGDVAAAVDGLVNQSLLTVFDDEVLGTRYRMLETVREYGEEQLVAAEGEADLVIERMLDWGRGFADAAEGDFQDGDQLAPALAVTTELDNLLAVLRAAVERGDARTAYSVFPVVGSLWMIRGSHLEVAGWAARIVALDETTLAGIPVGDRVLCTFEMAFLHLFYSEGSARTVARLRARVRRLLRTRDDLSPTYRLIGELMLSRSDLRGVGRRLAIAIRRGDPDTASTALLTRANMRENLGDVRGSTRDAIRALGMIGANQVWSVAMVCRHLGQVFGQIADYPASVTYYRRSLGMLLRLGVHEDTIEIRAMLVASLVGAGELAQAERELEFLSGVTRLGPIDHASGMHGQLAAEVMQSAAELALARGEVEEGLRRYERALEMFGWPEFGAGPGPGTLMTAAAAVDARILHGRARSAAELVPQVLEQGLRMLSSYRDLPQLGGMACAVGSYLVATGEDVERGLRLLALAPDVAARQDLPSMRLDRHVAAARARLGDEPVDRVLGVHRRAGREVAAREAIALLEALR